MVGASILVLSREALARAFVVNCRMGIKVKVPKFVRQLNWIAVVLGGGAHAGVGCAPVESDEPAGDGDAQENDPFADLGGEFLSDTEQECDGVAGLSASAIFETDLSPLETPFTWFDGESGLPDSSTTAQIAVTLHDDERIRCIPAREASGQSIQLARVGYHGVTLSMTTEDGLLNEEVDAVAWLTYDSYFTLHVVAALPLAEVSGSFSPSLGEPDTDTVLLVVQIDPEFPTGKVAVTSAAPASATELAEFTSGIVYGQYP